MKWKFFVNIPGSSVVIELNIHRRSKYVTQGRRRCINQQNSEQGERDILYINTRNTSALNTTAKSVLQSIQFPAIQSTATIKAHK